MLPHGLGSHGSAPYLAPEEYIDKEFDARAVDVWATCDLHGYAHRTTSLASGHKKKKISFTSVIFEVTMQLNFEDLFASSLLPSTLPGDEALLMHLLINHPLRLPLLLTHESRRPRQHVAHDNKPRRDGSLAIRDIALPAYLLDFALIRPDHILLSLDALSQRQEDETLGVVVQLARRFLDGGHARVEAVQGGVAERVRAGEEGGQVGC